jgi:hypothetical protein
MQKLFRDKWEYRIIQNVDWKEIIVVYFNLYCLDLIPHLQRQLSQYLALWYLHLFYTDEYAGGLSELCKWSMEKVKVLSWHLPEITEEKHE